MAASTGKQACLKNRQVKNPTLSATWPGQRARLFYFYLIVCPSEREPEVIYLPQGRSRPAYHKDGGGLPDSGMRQARLTQERGKSIRPKNAAELSTSENAESLSAPECRNDARKIELSKKRNPPTTNPNRLKNRFNFFLHKTTSGTFG